MASKIRLNFHTESEATINKQINLELHASYVYMAMVSLKNLKYRISSYNCRGNYSFLEFSNLENFK